VRSLNSAKLTPLPDKPVRPNGPRRLSPKTMTASGLLSTDRHVGSCRCVLKTPHSWVAIENLAVRLARDSKLNAEFHHWLGGLAGEPHTQKSFIHHRALLLGASPFPGWPHFYVILEEDVSASRKLIVKSLSHCSHKSHRAAPGKLGFGLALGYLISCKQAVNALIASLPTLF